MSKSIDILPPLLTRIGFNETDIKVYSATLCLGKVTIGELLVVTKLDPLTLIQSAKNLEELGFLKKISGNTPQYFALLPFLKEYIIIERDTLYSVDGIVTALKNVKESYHQDKEKFGGSLDIKGDTHIFDIHIVSGLVKQLLDGLYDRFVTSTDYVENAAATFLKDIQGDVVKHLSAVVEHPLIFSTQLDAFIKELNAFIKQFHHSADQKGSQLLDSVLENIDETSTNLKQFIINGLDAHTGNHKESLERVPVELDGVLKEQIKQIDDLQDSFIEQYNQVWNQAYSSWTNETRTMVEELSRNINDLFTNQIKQTQQLRRSVEQIDRKINFLTTKIAETLKTVESSSRINIGKTKKEAEDLLIVSRNTVRDLANDLNEGGLQLIDQHVIGLNEVRDQLKTELDHFLISGDTNIRTKKKQIADNGVEKMNLLPNEVLNAVQNEIEKYASSALESCNQVTDKLKETIEKKLTENEESTNKQIKDFTKNHTDVIIKLQTNVINELEKSRQDTEKMGNATKSKIQKYIGQFDKVVEEMQQTYSSEVSSLKSDLEKHKENSKTDLIAQVNEAEEMQINTVVSQVANVVKDVDEVLLKQMDSLLEKAMAYYQVVNNREDELKQIDKAASSYNFEGQHNTSIIVGEEAINASITDIAMRAKTSLLIVTPEIDEDLLKEMMQYTKAHRITLVSNYDIRKHQTILRPLAERFTGMKVKHYPKKDVYCGILDSNNEAVFAFLTTDEVPIGIRTTNELLLQLFKNAINRDVLFVSDDIEV